ncbi:hypothetical protein FRB96_006180 [Tulasnella sp. 330]|nr:hypothetical protein FRB96_006180 [Tulasnella sp. 330]
MSNSRPATEIYHSKQNVTLLQNFKGIVSTPADVETYQIGRWAPNVVKRAAYVVYPTDAADISVAILLAREEKLPIAICGGGHNSGGASSTEGIVIDMRKMNAVRVDKDNKIGYIQGGTTITQAVKDIFKHGMATVFGHVGSVGVVGLATGGGMGFKMGQHGLGCDNIVSATMVLANGQIVTVDDKNHPDLLWGIKGGGSNFGVIAELGMRLHETRADVCIMDHLYLPEQLPVIVTELQAWSEVQTPLEAIYFFCFVDPGDGKPYLAIHGVGDFGAEEGERLWGRFSKHNPIMSKVHQAPYDTYTAKWEEFETTSCNRVQGPVHISTFDYVTVKKAYDMWLAVIPNAPMSALFYEFYAYDLMAKESVDATAFALRTTNKLALIGIYGYAEEWTPEAKQAVKDIQACISSSSTEEAKGSIGYLNHSYLSTLDKPEKETDVIARRAFGPNYPRLQQLKRKYDPEMVFNKWFCIKPAEE